MKPNLNGLYRVSICEHSSAAPKGARKPHCSHIDTVAVISDIWIRINALLIFFGGYACFFFFYYYFDTGPEARRAGFEDQQEKQESKSAQTRGGFLILEEGLTRHKWRWGLLQQPEVAHSSGL
jgi:hypothetical protein